MEYTHFMNADSLRTALSGLPVPEIRYFDTIDSTNEAALTWIAAGAPDGSLVAADVQTAGRGRMGRRWITHSGAALAFSLILKAGNPDPALMSLHSPLGALALAEVLEAEPVPVSIKWPNDVLVRGKKVAGILVETAWQGDRVLGIAVGIGINVTPQAVPAPEELLYPATSVSGELGRPVDREKLLARVLERIFAWRARLGQVDFLHAWETRLAFKGQAVEVSPGTPGATMSTGTLIGVTGNGNLRLLGSDGMEQIIAAGDVRLRPVSANH
jgi:BirA family biotin operon repressor/biotin-[acetyl-CoA-carboxylase] ligase